jgi:hypothetical protein
LAFFHRSPIISILQPFNFFKNAPCQCRPYCSQLCSKQVDRPKTFNMDDNNVSFFIDMLMFDTQADTLDLMILRQMWEYALLSQQKHTLSSSMRTSPSRSPSVFDQRVNWDNFANSQREQSTNFRRHLRMSKDSFNKLLEFVRPRLAVDERMATLRGGAIIPELCLYCTIRWLAGGSYSDIFYFCGISKSSFYRLIWKTMFEISVCPDEYLKIRFPKTRQECRRISSLLSVIVHVIC